MCFAYLDVIVGIPIRVIDNDSISRSKVNAQTTSSGREEEGELLGTRSWLKEEHNSN